MRHFSLTVLSDFMASTIEYCWLYLITHFSDFQLASFGSFFLHEGVFFLSGLPFIFFERAGVLSKYKIQHKNNTPAAQEKCIVRVLLYHFCVNLPVMIVSYPVFRYMGLSSSLPLPSWKVVLAQTIFYFILEDFVFYWGHRILHTKWLYKHVHSVHHELLWKNCLSCSAIILAPVKNSSAFPERNYMWGSSSVALPFKKFIIANLSQRVVWMSALEKGPLTLYWKLDEVLSWQFVRYATPFGLTSEYAHPAEILFLGFATIIGPAITGPHLLTLWLWMTLRVLETVEAHSGYHFPWSLSNLFPLYGGADFHDYHHRLLYTKSGNYSSTFVYMDWIFGTDKGYRKLKALMRD